MHSKSRLPIYLLHGLGVIFLFSFFYLYPANEFLWMDRGDSVKNYYLFSYMVEHGVEPITNAAQYPYGEYTVFTDSQPCLVFCLHQLKSWGVLSEGYTIGVQNFILVFSIAITAIVLAYLLRKQFKVPYLLAIIGSWCLAFLSPQTFRLAIHAGLSYSWFIPITWLLLYKSETHKRYYGLLLFYLSICFFIHGYMGLFCVGFTLVYLVVDIFFSKRNWKVVFLLLLPLGIYQGVVMLDIFEGRNMKPLGMYDFVYHFDHAIRSAYGFFLGFPQGTPMSRLLFESQYLGIFPLLSIIPFIFLLQKKDRKKHLKAFAPIISPLMASICLLLFSLGYVQRLWEGIWDLLPPLQQFRDLQRFAWAFYLVFGYISIALWATFLENKEAQKRTKRRVFVLTAVLVLWMAEVGNAIYTYVNILEPKRNFFNKELLRKEEKQLLEMAKADDYQSLITFPYFHFWSGGIEVNGTYQSEKMAFMLAYHSKLPLMNAYLSRPSAKTAQALIGWVTPSSLAVKKEVDQKLDERPILVYKDQTTKLSTYQEQLIGQMDTLFSDKEHLLLRATKTIFLQEERKPLKAFEEIHALAISDLRIQTWGRHSLFSVPLKRGDYIVDVDLLVDDMDSLSMNKIALTVNDQVVFNTALSYHPFAVKDDQYVTYRMPFKVKKDTASVRLELFGLRERAVYLAEKLFPKVPEEVNRKQALIFKNIRFQKSNEGVVL